jgi:hypothetical protein
VSDAGEPAAQPPEGGGDELGEIEERLRCDGNRKRELTVVDRIVGVGVDVDDVRRRSARQNRQQQVAGAVAVAVALVISAGAVTAAARSLVISDPPVARPATAPTEPTAAAGDASAASTRSGPHASGGGTSTSRSTLPTTSESPAPTPSSTVAPTTPSSTANPSSTAPGGGIRRADLARAIGESSECDGPGRGEARKRSDRATVASIAYGDVVGDDREDAVVTVSCPDSPVAVHAAVYTVESAAPTGVRRVAGVEPDSFTRGLLAKQEIGSWKLAGVSVTGPTVESLWTGSRTGRGSGPPITWTGTSWLRIAPLHLTPTTR